jgi:hypothetical protein
MTVAKPLSLLYNGGSVVVQYFGRVDSMSLIRPFGIRRSDAAPPLARSTGNSQVRPTLYC